MKAVRAILNDHTILMYANGALTGAAVAGAISFNIKPFLYDVDFETEISNWIKGLNESDDFERIEIID